MLFRTLLLVILSWFSVNAAVWAKAPTILVVGDSLSAAYGIEVKQGWVQLLREQLMAERYPHQVINASISGDTTGGGMRRLPALLKAHAPVLVIIELGANDGLRGVPLSEVERNFTQMLSMTRATQARTVILRMELPPNYGPAYTQGFAKVYDQLARVGPDVVVAPFFLAEVVLVPGLIQADGLHPTAAAQPRMLKAVWESIKSQLKPP